MTRPNIVVLVVGIAVSLHVGAQEESPPRLTAIQVRCDAGRCLDALGEVDRLLESNSRLPGPAHAALGAALAREALQYRAAGVYAKAEPLYQRALTISEKLHGSEHPTVAALLNDLAEVFQALGEFAHAEPLLWRVITIRENTLGPEDPETAVAFNNIGSLYARMNQRTAAASLLERGLAIQERALGPEHPTVTASLNNLAQVYSDARAYSKAEPLYKRTLANREKLLGPQHPDTADALSTLAAHYSATAAYSQAERLYLRALKIYEKSLGPEHPTTAKSLHDLGEVHRATRAYSAAEPLLQRALAIRMKVLGPLHPDTIASFYKLAETYSAKGATAQLESLYRRALSMYEKTLGPEHSAFVTLLNNLGGSYLRSGADLKAAPLLERALTLCEQALGHQHPETATALGNLAKLHTDAGAYTKAEPLHQRALAINEAALGPEHLSVATSLNSLGEFYRITGAYARAEPLLVRALAITETVLGPQATGTAAVLNNLALIYTLTGAHTKAEPLHRRALAINERVLGPDHPQVATSLSNLAEHYRSSGAYAEAEPLLQRALAINATALSPDNPGVAIPLNNLALYYSTIGAYTQAEALFERALAITENALGLEHPNVAFLLNNLGELCRIRGAYSRAGALHRRALAITEKALGPSHPATARALQFLGLFYTGLREFRRGERLYERFQRIEEDNTLHFMLAGSESRKLQYMQQSATVLSTTVGLSLINRSARSTALSLMSVLQYKGRVLDTMSDSMARLRRSVAPEDRALLEQLANVVQELSTLTYGSSSSLPTQAHRERLDALVQRQDTLQAQLSARSAVFRQAAAPITLADVQRALPEDAVLLEWIRYKYADPKANPKATSTVPHYLVYVLKRTGNPVAIDVGEAQPIEALILRFREALTDPTSDSRGARRERTARVPLRELATELSAKLIQPLRPYLSPKHRLLFSPDAALNLLPFAALLDEQGEYLAQNFEISYLTSGRDLLRIATNEPARSGPVVLAAPSYGDGTTSEPAGQSIRSADLDRSGLVFASLPGTDAEAKSLQSLLQLDAQHVFTGERASEAQLRALHGPSILHLATHGFFLSDEDLTVLRNPTLSLETGLAVAPLIENPLLRSGLALAGANRRRWGNTDDGILTAAEVAQLDLVGTQLVVLSACETALGTLDGGEGVHGLRRALVLAGAQSQLVSMWKIGDAATQKFMTDYYQRLLKGEGRAAALQSVQRAMLAAPASQHPYYWAAFVAIGNWTPLEHRP